MDDEFRDIFGAPALPQRRHDHRARPPCRACIAFQQFGIDAMQAHGIAAPGIGIALGENEIVLRKAVNICLECIGLG